MIEIWAEPPNQYRMVYVTVEEPLCQRKDLIEYVYAWYEKQCKPFARQYKFPKKVYAHLKKIGDI